MDIVYPDDVLDSDALRDLLRDTDIFGKAQAEADGYLADALERFRVTIALLPELSPGARVLELGSNPYFLTRILLERGLDVTCANWFGADGGYSARDVQRVRGPRSGWEHDFTFDHFNIECDRFPYEDESFDLVLCCEILEHLPTDPTHMLAEIHRVARKPDGVMVLTTPNATRVDNLLRMTDGRNVYESLSGYGAYGRHNREYTVDELRDLLIATGFLVDRVFARDVHGVLPIPRRVRRIAATGDRGDNLFAIARAVGEERWSYPPWLYQSRHAIRHVVRPDVVVGLNDDVQSDGLHEELAPRDVRWTGPGVATLTLEPAPDAGTLRIEGEAPPVVVGAPIVLRAEWPDGDQVWTIPCDGRPFSVAAPIASLVLDPSTIDVCLSTDRTWQPRSVGISDDERELGVAIRSVSIQ